MEVGAIGSRSLEKPHVSTKNVSETEVATTKPTWICARSCTCMFWFLACVFVVLLTVCGGVSLTLANL